MNSTNRFVNRTFLFVVGLVVLALGAAVTAVALVPVVRDGWDTAAGDVDAAVRRALSSTPLGDSGHSWILLAVAAACAVIVVVLLVLVFRRGGGRTATIATTSDPALGTGTVDSAVAVQTLQQALSAHDEFVGATVTAYRVRGEAALYVAVRCRRGISPAVASATVHRVLGALDVLLGVRLPTLIHISGGFRTRLASTTRLDAVG